MNGQELNAPAVSLASIAAGVATVLEFVPPLAGALSSIGGVILLHYLLKHKRLQVKLAERELDE